MTLPRTRGHAAAQVLLFVVADLLYEAVRGLVVGRPSAAFAHAHAIVRLERGLGIYVEPAIQRHLIGHPAVLQVANWLYLNVQFTANAAFLAFVYLQRHAAYARARNALFIAMGVALVVHLLLPVAPPRLLPGDGFVDTVKTIAHVDQDTGAVGAMVNPYAAVPSMHVCFALIVGWTGMHLAAHRAVAAAWAAYPLLVVVVVVVTANHFIFDAVTGGCAAAVAVALAAVTSRRRAASTGMRPARSPIAGEADG